MPRDIGVFFVLKLFVLERPNVGHVNDTLEAAFAGNLMDLTETTKAAFNSFGSSGRV